MVNSKLELPSNLGLFLIKLEVGPLGFGLESWVSFSKSVADSIKLILCSFAK
jgi:hypothetical protein